MNEKDKVKIDTQDDKNEAVSSHTESGQTEPDTMDTKGKKKLKKWQIGLISAAAIICILIAAAAITANNMLNQINYEAEEDIIYLPTDIETPETAEQPQEEIIPVEEPILEIEESVINIVLIGEEAMDDDMGRSDTMMIATINREQKTLKLTSLLRDIYVEIPGYLDNKLNAAFHNGGGALLSQTIEHNFGIKIDGYVRVDFRGFEKIIDMLGGVEITLTGEEATYLNTTNYISNWRYRNVRTGTQLLNGNQALGYCRIRAVPSENNEIQDFGRTDRNRTVLNAIFSKYKTRNVVDMVSIANSLLPYITTNLTSSQIIDYLTAAVTLGATELEMMRIPYGDAYYGTKRQIGQYKRYVIVLEKERNKAELIKFLYGENHYEKFGITPEMFQESGSQ